VQAEVLEPAAMREAEALAERLAPRRKPLATAPEDGRDRRRRSGGVE